MTFFSFSTHEWWTIAIGALCAVACALPGCFLVLRRLSLVGDAVSHAILPGIAAAFLISGSRDIAPMLVGAACAGLITVLISQFLSRVGRVAEDASIGVVFSCMFALGVLLITRAASSVDLDAGCVLFGQLETVALDRAALGAPRAFVTLGCAALVNITLVAVLFKELKLAAFDGALAHAMGFRPGALHALLMATVAATCVASFEAVGSVLVVAMIVAPPTTARLWTDRLARMLVIAAAIGALSSLVGYALARHFNASAAGMMAVVASGAFAVSVLFAPRAGLFFRALRGWRLRLRIAGEDLLGALYRRHEGRDAPIPERGFICLVARRFLLARGMITLAAGTPALTPRGIEEAARVIRSHRLWETYLAQNLNLPVDHLHGPSEVMEHFIDEPLAAKLKEEVAAEFDAQGRKIP